MKKVLYKTFKLCLVLCCLVVLFPIKSINASERIGLYVNTKINENSDVYVENNISSFIMAHGYDYTYANNLEVGKGIYIDDPNDVEKYVYPIWNDDTIVATFLVYNLEGVYSGSYSTMYANQLNELYHLTNQTTPLSIAVRDEDIFGIISNNWYNLNEDLCISKTENYVNNLNLEVLNAYEKIDYVEKIQSRASTSNISPFTIYQKQPSGEAKCYSYALGNMLMNRGYSSYTPANIQSYMKNIDAALISQLVNYCNSKNLTFSYSLRGYASVNNVKMYIDAYDYILVYAEKYGDSSTTRHVFVIIGYTYDGVNTFYRFWNPWYSDFQTMDSSTRIMPTKTSTSYYWNNGYIYNVH